MDEPSKNSVPDTPLLTIKEHHFLEVAKGQLVACSHYNIPIINVPGSDQLLVQVDSGEENIVRAKVQQEDDMTGKVLPGNPLIKRKVSMLERK